MTARDPLEALGRVVAEQQDRALAEQDLRGARPDFHARARAPRAHPSRTLLAAVAVAAGVAAAGAVSLSLPRSSDALTFHVEGSTEPGAIGTWLGASGTEGMALQFSDGTTIVLDPGARARVVRIDRLGADLVLEGGRAHASFVPGRGGKWNVSVGPFGVAVTGTRFDVSWRPDEDLFELSLDAGHVNLSGCSFGESRPLEAGEVARAWCRQNRFEITKATLAKDPGIAAHAEPTAAPSADLGAARGEPTPAPSSAPPAESAGHPAADGRPAHADRAPGAAASARAPDASGGAFELIRTGKYREGVAAAVAAGFDGVCARSSLAELEALARAARLSGDSARAATAYRLLRDRYPRTEEAATAAFYLGRIAFDGRGDYADAARWFRTYLDERPRGSLAREALGRSMEARQRSGDAAGAKRAAEQYLGSYPGGPHAELARTLSTSGP